MGGPNFAPNGLQKHVQKSSTPSKLNPSHVLPLPAALTANVAFALFFAALYYLFKNWDPNNTSSSSPLVELMATLSLVASCILFLAFGLFRIACFSRLFGVMYMQRSTGSKSLDDSWDVQDDERGLLVQACTTSSAPLSFAQGKRDQQMLLGLKLQDNNDDHIANAVCDGTLPSHSLEAELGDPRRAALVRKKAVELMTNTSLDALPLDGFDYASVLGQCCEMVIGYLQIPIGVAGPLLLDGFEYMIPMATTEGCLVASTNRGCKAIHLSGGASSVLLRDGMTRAPIVRFLSAQRAAELKFYVEDANNLETLCVVFSRTSRFARLQCIQCALAGRNLYMRFVCSTGDAMGMNMVSKGVQNVLRYLQHLFPDMEEVSISGNYCADKKATAVNWIKGRGKSVVCDAVIKGEVVAKVLKTTVPALVELNMLKNLAGSAVAGALGGYNAHASNVVTAIFIATGQDPAQNVESSHCITIMEPTNNGHDLHVSVTMPSIEVGTVGGGTQLASQSACLNLLGVKGPSKECPGANAQGLARIVAGAVLAGELSLLSALAAGHLVKSHMKYNRSNKNLPLDVVEGATTKGSL